MFVGLNKVKVGQCKSVCGTETGSTNNNYILSKFLLLQTGKYVLFEGKTLFK